MAHRSVYVLSDLHLGGDPNDVDVPGGRGFKMCHQGPLLAEFIERLADGPHTVELVIAGDFVDFLAERPVVGEDWSPFHRDADDAVALFRTIATQREPQVFSALARLLAAGHHLTILLGNHDLELSLPAVRGALVELLGGTPHFLYDNEAYVVGDAIIEHGNRADPANEVDHDALRRVRVLQSRRADSARHAPFTPPVGSRIVAGLMNPLKQKWPFIDLLKPEGAGMAPVLLAMDPVAAVKLPRLLAMVGRIGGRATLNRIKPAWGDEIAGEEGATLEDIVRDQLPAEDADVLLSALEEAGTGTEIAGGFSSTRADLAFVALRKLVRDDHTFDVTEEQGGGYRDAAQAHLDAGFKWVVFGHTHRAVCERMDGGVYLNSGTWADLMSVPPALQSEDEEEAQSAARAWLQDVHAGDLEQWVRRRPTFVKLDVDGDRVVAAELRVFEAGKNPDSGELIAREV
jgi:UDP-2,3-diacylglucosamine pyrophosphatase LpxH